MPAVALLAAVTWALWAIAQADLHGDRGVFVRHSAELTGDRIVDCEETCRADSACRGFYVAPHNDLSVNVTKHENYSCFTLSHRGSAILGALPFLLPQSGSPGCYGQLLDEAAAANNNLSPNHIDVVGDVLLKAPIAMSTFTLLSFPQRLKQGCEVTISLFFWLHQPAEPLPKYKAIRILDTNPLVLPNVDPYRDGALLPSLLFNVGEQADRFFFSLRQGAPGEYFGMWLGAVRYHTWVHAAFSISADRADFYLDGQYVDYLLLGQGKSAVKEQLRCDAQAAAMRVTCAGLSGNRTFVSAPRGVDNAIIKLGGYRGLVAGLVVTPRAASADEMATLFQRTRPTSAHALAQLAQTYDTATAARTRAVTAEHANPYVLLALGLPGWSHGRDGVCILAAALSPSPADRCGVHEDGLTLENEQTNGVSTVPDIGILLPTRPHRQHDPNAAPVADPPVGGSALANATLVARVLGHIHTFVREVLPAGRKDDDWAVTMLGAPAAWESVSPEDEQHLSENDRRYLAYLRDVGAVVRRPSTAFIDTAAPHPGTPGADYYLAHPLGQVQGLYRASRLAIHAHAPVPITSHAATSALADPNGTAFSPAEVAVSNFDRALQLAFLALALADELPAHPNDETWTFRTAGQTAQPLLLLLANTIEEHERRLVRVVEGNERAAQKELAASPLKRSRNASEAAGAVMGAEAWRGKLAVPPDRLAAFQRALGMPDAQTSGTEQTLTGGRKNVWSAARSARAAASPPVPVAALFWLRRLQENVRDEVTLRALVDAVGVAQTLDGPNTASPPFTPPVPPIPSLGTFLQEFDAQPQYTRHHRAAYQAAYLFPVTQYVAANYGLVHSGSGVLEEVLVRDVDELRVGGYGGEDDQQHFFTRHDAEANDPAAQVWMGKKYFWGFGGLAPDAHRARYWFERAAAQGHAEGLYNVGALLANGQGGMARDADAALRYFARAAEAAEPFPLALVAMGNHHLQRQERPQAEEFYRRAALLGAPEGLFSLAVLLREQGDIRGAVQHLCNATARGHLRSANYLAHALFDPNSWLGHYGREQALTAPLRAYARALDAAVPTEDDEAPIICALPGGEPLPLPRPLGNVVGAVDAALPLLRFIALRSYRPKDLMHIALQRYLRGDTRGALEAYEEAADLGLGSARRNTLHVLNRLANERCAPQDVDSLRLSPSSSSADPALAHTVHPAQGECLRALRLRGQQRHWELVREGDASSLRALALAELDSDPALGMWMLEQAAERGSSESAVDLGWRYYTGQGVARNVSRARELFVRALAVETRRGAEQHTAGVAPGLALALLRADELLQAVAGVDLWTVAERVRVARAGLDASLLGLGVSLAALALALLAGWGWGGVR